MSAALDGVWEMMRAESGGENSQDLIALKVELEVGAGVYIVRFAGQIADRGTFSIDGNDAFILTGLEGPNQGRTIPCLFQRVGDRLRVCYGLDGIAPISFASPVGSTHYLATYRMKNRTA